VREGEAQQLGGPIARLGGDPEPENVAATASPTPTAAPPPTAAPAPAHPNGSGRPLATPVARSRAHELGVDLATLSGTGPRGRIRLADVESAATAAPAGPAPATAAVVSGAPAPVTATTPGRGHSERLPLTPTQRVIAQRMAETTATVPHFRLSADVDFGEVLRLRKRLRSAVGDAAPTVNDIVVALAGRALREHPAVNSAFAGEAIERFERVNIGIAVARPGALLVPVVRDADRRSLGEIARETAALIERVRTSSSTPADLQDGTFTVSNLGMYGISAFDSIVNAPEAAILSVGAAQARALVGEDGAVSSRPYATLTLACDHRAVYGADGAAFLARLRALLESPEVLVL
jgi:pyruvate dehydrogenase E2 component (dihydrolipoamide acetyltransferase)